MRATELVAGGDLSGHVLRGLGELQVVGDEGQGQADVGELKLEVIVLVVDLLGGFL